MGRDTYALLTGLFVVILGGMLVLMAFWLGQYGNDHNAYLVTTQHAISGLKPESTVYYRGVEAGKVASMGFDPKDAQTIRVRIEVRKNIPVTSVTFARLRVQPLTGLAQIELGNAVGDAKPLLTSDSDPAKIPLHQSLMDQLADSGQGLLGQADQLLVSLNDLLKGENRGRLDRILSNFEAASARLAALEERLDRGLAGLPVLSSDAHRTLTHIDELAVDLKDVAQHLRGFGKLGDELEQTTLPRVNAALGELQSAATQMKRLSTQLDKDPQALLLGPPIQPPGPGEPGYQEPRSIAPP